MRINLEARELEKGDRTESNETVERVELYIPGKAGRVRVHLRNCEGSLRKPLWSRYSRVTVIREC